MWPVPMADNLTTFMCRLSWNLGASASRNPQGLSRPVMGSLFAFTYTRAFYAPGRGSASVLHKAMSKILWRCEMGFTLGHDGPSAVFFWTQTSFLCSTNVHCSTLPWGCKVHESKYKFSSSATIVVSRYTGFSPITSASSCQYHLTNSRHSSFTKAI